MNPRSVISALIGLNLCLAAVLASGFRLRHKRAPPVELAGTDVAQETRLAAGPVEEGGPARGSSRSPGKFTWRSLSSSDLKTYVANLRRIDCPEGTIRDIIVAEVNRRFAPRERALKFRRQDYRPWEEPPSHPLAVQERQGKLRKLVREKQALLVGLLGGEVPGEVPEFAVRPGAEKYETAYSRLPDQERKQAWAIQELYWEKTDELRARTLGYLEPEDREELLRLKVERRAALARVMTPEELEDFDLETSQAAERLRSRMAGFNPTDQEFRAVFELVQATEGGSLAEGGPSEAEDEAQRQAREEALEEQIRATLGEARYTELERSRTPEFRDLVRIAAESGLPRDRAIRAYEIREAWERESLRLQGDPELSEPDRRSALRALAAETEQALLEALERSGLEKLNKSGRFLPGPPQDRQGRSTR